MWQKLRNFPVKAYLAAADLAREFKEDERGLSGVVVAVLLILVAVLAVVMIWGGLSGWLGELWTKITSQANSGLTPGTLP